MKGLFLWKFEGDNHNRDKKERSAKMRVFTKEEMDTLQKNPAYRLIMNRPAPDMSELRKEAETFARWIAREHKKERENLARASV